MQTLPDAADDQFRAEVRAFVRDNLPEDLARRARHDFHLSREDKEQWCRILADRGWSMPHWPAEYGGPGWTALQGYIFEDEMRAAYAPTIDRIGPELVAPVIYTFGSQAQKDRYLPSIRTGKEFWAQGFSEPGSGSDLSSLRTRAIRDGDYYIVNGQKTWTTEGHQADLIFMLVRTNTEVKPQAGISALVIDLKSPGVEMRPIWTIDEGLTVNEVFFDDVRVPAANLIGEEGAGWTYAKFLLTNERASSAEVPHTKRDIAQLHDIASRELFRGRPLIEDAAFRAKLAHIEIDTLALEYAVMRVVSANDPGGDAAVASVLKIRGSELRQRVAELASEALGDAGLAACADPESAHVMFDDGLSCPVPDHGIGITPKAMFRRATTIYGGANEIQRTLIAKAVLGL